MLCIACYSRNRNSCKHSHIFTSFIHHLVTCEPGPVSKTQLLLIIYLGTQIINTQFANLRNGKINAQFDEQYNEEPTGFYGNTEAGIRDSIVIGLSGNFPEGFKVKLKIKEVDPKAFVVVTDAYDTFGEGWKTLPSVDDLQPE